MSSNKHGLYICGHGETITDVFCFIPPMFTEIAMAENYGRLLRNMECKYSKQPVFSMINDINIKFIGLTHRQLSDDSVAIFFPEMSHTGIAIRDLKHSPNIDWSTKFIKANLFDYFIKDDLPKTTQYANILRHLNMNVDVDTKVITASTRYPLPLYDVELAEFGGSKMNKLIHKPHKLSDTISPIDLQAANDYIIAHDGNTSNISQEHIRTIKRVLYICYINGEFLHSIGIETEHLLDDVYKYLSNDYLAKHADKLLLNKILHIDVDQSTTSDKFTSFLLENKCEANVSTLLNQLKANLVESRLMESNIRSPFKLWCSTCRGITPVDERKSKYNTIKSIFEPHDNVPKSVRQFALDNTRELAPIGEKEQFRGILSPHIVISNILYPCFLYCMDPDTCDLLPEFTDEIRGLFRYMITNLPLYTLDKPTVLRFIELVTAKFVDSMVTSIAWSIEQVTYTGLLTSAFNTLTLPDYKYTIEDIILVYGIVIYNMPTYLDLASPSYRTAANIHPHEYHIQTHNTHNSENSSMQPYGTIWNLPDNSQSSPKTNNTWLEPVMSKKQRKLLAKESRRTKRLLNIQPAKSDLSPRNTLIKLASDILIKHGGNIYPYLTNTVKTKPKTHILRLFQMVTRFDV